MAYDGGHCVVFWSNICGELVSCTLFEILKSIQTHGSSGACLFFQEMSMLTLMRSCRSGAQGIFALCRGGARRQASGGSGSRIPRSLIAKFLAIGKRCEAAEYPRTRISWDALRARGHAEHPVIPVIPLQSDHNHHGETSFSRRRPRRGRMEAAKGHARGSHIGRNHDKSTAPAAPGL